jgi:hypothetical protein
LTFDFAEQFVGVFGPGKWVAAVVIGVDELPDGGSEVFDGGEGAAADGLASDDPEEDLYLVQPRAPGWGEVQGDPLVARLSQPRADFGMLVRAVVVVPCRT